MRVGVLTGGGDCPGLNSALRGIVLRALDYQDEIIGLRDGWAGLLRKDVVPLTLDSVRDIIGQGGTVLGTSRTNPLKKEEDMQTCLENLEALGIEALIAIGGDDTLRVALELFRRGAKTVGVPKTIDNDLSGIDYTFGFASAVEAAVDAAERLQDTARSHRRVIVMEVMGRDAGWVALATAVCSGADWVWIPEITSELTSKDFDALCQRLDDLRARGKDWALIIVSEGVRVAETTEDLPIDAFGHPILAKRRVGEFVAEQIEKRTRSEVRAVVPGYIVRGGRPATLDRWMATRLGIKAVDMIHDGNFGCMASLSGAAVTAVDMTEALKPKLVPPHVYSELSTLFGK